MPKLLSGYFRNQCPDAAVTLSGCFRNGCPDKAEIRSFAPVAAVERVIKDKDILPAVRLQRLNGFFNDS